MVRELWSGAVLPHPDRETLVVEADGEIVGMARIGVDPLNSTRGHLFSLYISPIWLEKG